MIVAALVLTLATVVSPTDAGQDMADAVKAEGTPAANAYLATIRTHLTAEHAAAEDVVLLTLAESICHAFDRDVTASDMVHTAVAGGYSSFEAGALIGGEVATMCPNHQDALHAQLPGSE